MRAVTSSVYVRRVPADHARIRSAQGTFRRIDTPYGAQSQATGINDPGVIVGNGWNAADDLPPAFELRNGQFTRFDFPGAAITFPLAITNQGDLAGRFLDPDGTM